MYILIHLFVSFGNFPVDAHRWIFSAMFSYIQNSLIEIDIFIIYIYIMLLHLFVSFGNFPVDTHRWIFSAMFSYIQNILLKLTYLLFILYNLCNSINKNRPMAMKPQQNLFSSPSLFCCPWVI